MRMIICYLDNFDLQIIEVLRVNYQICTYNKSNVFFIYLYVDINIINNLEIVQFGFINKLYEKFSKVHQYFITSMIYHFVTTTQTLCVHMIICPFNIFQAVYKKT